MYIEEFYVDKRTGQQVPLQYPKIHLNNKMGYNESAEIMVLSGIYEREVKAPMKSFMTYSMKVQYNGIEMYAVLTPVLASRLRQYQIGDCVKVTRTTGQQGKTDLVVTPLDNVLVKPAPVVTRPVTPQPMQNVPQNKAFGTPSQTPKKGLDLGKLKQATQVVEENIGVSEPVKKAQDMAWELLSSPEARSLISNIAHDYGKWKEIIIDHAGLYNDMIDETTWTKMYEEWTIEYHKFE